MLVLTWKRRLRHNRDLGGRDLQLEVQNQGFFGKEPDMELVQQQEENRESKVFRVASELYRQDPDWVTFFREVLGVEGVVRRVFANPAELAQFEQTREYAEIQQMVAKLRERASEPIDSREPTRVITVRLPKSLHESLRTEAHERKTSMNKLCISKLLQMVDDELIPTD
jgi:predicted HicB family RNase H-like nuclease